MYKHMDKGQTKVKGNMWPQTRSPCKQEAPTEKKAPYTDKGPNGQKAHTDKAPTDKEPL